MADDKVAQIKNMYREAQELAAEGDIKGSTKTITKALGIAPAFPDLLCLRAIVLAIGGNLASAMDDVNLALIKTRSDNDFVPSMETRVMLRHLRVIHGNAKEYDECLDDVQQLIKMGSRPHPTWFLPAFNDIHRKRDAEAEEWVTRLGTFKETKKASQCFFKDGGMLWTNDQDALSVIYYSRAFRMNKAGNEKAAIKWLKKVGDVAEHLDHIFISAAYLAGDYQIVKM
ncbi:MAG: hypothetical protein NUW37_05945 [Planctomycetes bacterium]|nr:hypothetical protein [Planctomycetota bacterium]